jgi:hypothetical protein
MLIIALLAFLGLRSTPAPEPNLPTATAIEAPAEAAATPIAPVKEAEAMPEAPG